jgi:hypothetical protein
MATVTVAGEWVPIAEAAARLGLNVDQVRRRIRSGDVHARKTPSTRGGPARHEVWVEAASTDEAPGDGDKPPGEPPSESGETPGVPPGDHQVPEATALAAGRAAEMAAYTRALLEPLHIRLEAQAERIGRLEAELAAERAERERRECEYAAAGRAAEEAARQAAHRPWWRFW